MLTEGGGGLFLCFIFYDRRRNWENGKRKLFISPGIHYNKLLTLLRERLRPENDWVCLMRDFEITCLLCTKGSTTVGSMWQRAKLDRDTFPTLQGISTPLASWGPMALGLLRDSSLVWTLVFSWWSHQQSQQFHCVQGYTSQGLEQGTAREEEGDNGRSYVENVVDRPMRTLKALWSLLETGKILSYPWMVSAMMSLVQLFTSITLTSAPSLNFCVMYLTFCSVSH